MSPESKSSETSLFGIVAKVDFRGMIGACLIGACLGSDRYGDSDWPWRIPGILVNP
ncbi:MAG: hypothetical protein NTV29_11020 [Planctomycetota bacterium]|nr:hypothetical protein [Planctomycetota bacterium]